MIVFKQNLHSFVIFENGKYRFMASNTYDYISKTGKRQIKNFYKKSLCNLLMVFHGQLRFVTLRIVVKQTLDPFLLGKW